MIWLIPLLVGCKKEEPADLIVEGNIHLTVTETAKRMAIRDGVVVALDDDVDKVERKDTEILELDGHVFPGMIDAHTHLIPGSFVLERLILLGINNNAGIQNAVGPYARSLPKSEPWVVGYGWLPSEFDENDPPNGLALDAITDRPALIVDNSGHSALCNSKALKLAGIDENTPDPKGGEIVRDNNGNLTGWLREEALSLVSEVALADYGDDVMKEAVAGKLGAFVGAGHTGVADVMASPGFDVGRPWIYQQLEDEGRLDMRIHYYIPIFEPGDVAKAAELKGVYDGELVTFAGGKVWVDGSMSALSAWTNDPYEGDKSNHGSHYFEESDLVKMIEDGEALGVPLKLHVNGDAAIETALDAFQKVSDANGGLELTHVFDHVVLLSDVDRARMSELGIVASVQPTHGITSQFGSAPEAWGDRFDHAYDVASFVDQDVTVALGTDWPVVPTADPIVGMVSSATLPNGHDISVEEAIRGYTEGSAMSVGRPDLGNLHVDSLADFVVLSQDPRDVDTSVLSSTVTVDQVWVGGRQVK